MPVENSAGAVIFREDIERKYLLLLYKGKNFDYWEFSRGRMEKGEDEMKTILREVEEETGIKDMKIIRGFKEKINFYYKKDGRIIYKDITYVLGKAKNKEIKLSQEHLDFCWVSYEEALNKLKFRNDKEVLKKAEEYLKKRGENEKF